MKCAGRRHLGEHCTVIAFTLSLGAIGTTRAAEDAAPAGRNPQWPLKTSRTLTTDAQIARARKLCETDENARRIRDRLIAASAYWIAQSDEALRALLPDGRVPRAFNVSTEGCPVHRKAIYKHGTYPWKLDRDHPFTIICPIGGERYPSNDFEAYYRSGFRDASVLTGPYADSGRGWVSPDGEKYWLVGYACHWHWMKTWLPAVTTLSQTYMLTGEPVYARKAIVMLDRIAEVYPGMDYSKQSRYAELMHGHYYGKILNAIWETNTLRRLAVAYDAVFDALIGEQPISLASRTPQEIRANIEANVLEEGIDAVGRGQIRGNFGMHQSALAYAVVVRQNGPTAELLDRIFSQTGGFQNDEGLDYALYNLVFKDGMPYETSPGYCAGWVSHFVVMARALSLAGMNLFERPTLGRMFDAPIEMLCAGEFTPAIGDAGSITSGWIGPGAGVYEAAYRHLRDPKYAWMLQKLGGLKGARISSFDDLFVQPIRDDAIADAKTYRHRASSRVMDGYGLAVLNNAKDSIAVSMYYGIRGGHGHFDRLNIELFGQGRRLSPDLGYPDFMNAFVPGIYSWSKNTISHNCLVVNKTIQPGNAAGTVLRFHDSPTVDVVDVDASGTYPQADVYRRTLVLIDVGEDASYLVDVFRVRGGEDHTLSIHGAEGQFGLTGASLSPAVTEGTLAGADVRYGQLYDDAVRGKPGYTGGYSGYRGSGYQHFFNWQKAAPDAVVTGRWRLTGEPAAQLRVHVLPGPGQELIVADAYVSPTQKIPTVLKYMLVKRRSDASGQTFVTVWEPYAEVPIIDRVELYGDAVAKPGHERAVALAVHRGDVVDRIVVAPTAGTFNELRAGLRCDAAVAVITERNDMRVRTFAAGGTQLIGAPASQSVEIPRTVVGTVQQADYDAKRIQVALESGPVDAASLVGHSVRILNAHHSCMYTIAGAERSENELTLALAGSDIFTGRIKIEAVDSSARIVKTPTSLLYPHNIVGMNLVRDDLGQAIPILAVDKGVIRLGGQGELTLSAGHDAWIADMGVGDRIEIERFIYELP
jgi:hypothetical protein